MLIIPKIVFCTHLVALNNVGTVKVPTSSPWLLTHVFQCLYLCHHQWHMYFSAYICTITSDTCFSVPISVPSTVTHAFQCHIFAITSDTCISVPFLCHHQWHMHFSAISVQSPVTHAFQCHFCAITSDSVPLQDILDIADKFTIYTIQYTVVLFLVLFQNAKLHHVHFHFTYSTLLSL